MDRFASGQATNDGENTTSVESRLMRGDIPNPRSHIRNVVRDSLHFHRPALDLGPAVRGMLCLALTLSPLGFLDRLDLAVYAVCGAIVSVYRGPSAARRWRSQLLVACLLTAAVITGSVTSTVESREWLIIPVAAAWAGVATRLSLSQEWTPPGAFPLVFAATATGATSLPFVDLLAGCLLTAATAALAVLLGAAEAKIGVRGPGFSADRSYGELRTSSEPSAARGPIDHFAGACVLAVLVAGTLATLTPLLYPSWALVAAVVPYATVPFHRQIVRGLHRISGTAIGLLIIAGILLVVPMWQPLPVHWFIVLVIALQAGAQLLVEHNYALALVLVTPLALLLTTQTTSVAVENLLVSRILETVLGVTVGLLVALLVREKTASVPTP